MILSKSRLVTPMVALLALLALSMGQPVMAAEDGCEGEHGFEYLCGLPSAEDMVLIPGTHWIIASGFTGGISLALIDAGQKTWAPFYPADAPMARQDMAVFGACPGSPNPNAFEAHGLNIRPGKNGLSTLYVVGHGEREAIEVFEVDASGERPSLAWVGCVLTPDGLAANSVASLTDGSLLATIPLHAGFDINQLFFGEPTGAVYAWSPGEDGFTRVEGTEMPYANGIEVSADGSEFFIASSGLVKVMAFSNTNPAKLLRSSETLSFIPDNLHRDDEGRLITAGLELIDPVCGDLSVSGAFDLLAFMSCPRPFTVLAVDPQSMQGQVIVRSPAHENFSNITMALTVNGEIWIGTFAGDRVAYGTLADVSDHP